MCQVPFLANRLKSAAHFGSSYVRHSSSATAGLNGAARSSSSFAEQVSRRPVRCSMLFCPASDAAPALSANGTWPANGRSSFLASSAIAWYASGDSVQ